MNRRDIKNKNKIGDAEGNENELQPLHQQGFSEGFISNGLNTKFGECSIAAYACSILKIFLLLFW